MDTQDFDSIVFIEDFGQAGSPHFTRTAGALGAMQEMGGGWSRLARVLRWVPSWFRDAIYKMIARIRYRIFGRYRPTPLPNPQWAERILE